MMALLIDHIYLYLYGQSIELNALVRSMISYNSHKVHKKYYDVVTIQ
jgi:hypothetical protein